MRPGSSTANPTSSYSATAAGAAPTAAFSSASLAGAAGSSAAGSASAKRTKRFDEVHIAASNIQHYFLEANHILIASVEAKQELFTAHVYEIAFINLLSAGELAQRDEVTSQLGSECNEGEAGGAGAGAGGSGSRGHSASRKRAAAAAAAAASAKASQEFAEFVRDADAANALRQGQAAIALLNGGGGLDGDVSSALAEMKRQADFWKAVAQRTHKHNAMLTESRRMLEQAAQRSGALVTRIAQLEEKIAEADREVHDEQIKNKMLRSEKSGLAEQLASLQEQAHKTKLRLDHQERAEKAGKKEKEKDALLMQETEGKLKAAEQNLKQAVAAVDLLTSQLSMEKTAHRHVRTLYDAIVGSRRIAAAQTEISGSNINAEAIAMNFAVSRAAAVADHYHAALLEMGGRAVAAERKADVGRKCANDALLSLEETQRVQGNREAAFAEQTRQLKLEAQAQTRRADEERAKFRELAQSTEQLQQRLRESQLELQHRDTTARLRRGEAQIVATQTDVSFDSTLGSAQFLARSMRKVAMAAQTDDAWYSDMAAQANLNTRSFLWTRPPTEEEAKKERSANYIKGTKDLAAEHQLNAVTILSGKKAKEAIQGARETVKQILTSGNTSSTSSSSSVSAACSISSVPAAAAVALTTQTAAQQRKEMLGAIRALSEAVTLSASHIKDLETEIERVLLDAARAKPCKDQACYAATDARGNLIVSGSRYEVARVVDTVTTTTTAASAATSSSSKGIGTKQTPTKEDSADRFNFGLQHAQQQQQQQQQSSSQQRFANTFMTPTKDTSSYQFNTMNPAVVHQHQQNQQQHLALHHHHQQQASPSTALQQLLNRGDSLEQQPHDQSSARLPSFNMKNRDANDVLSRIETAQRLARAALEVKSPPGLQSSLVAAAAASSSGATSPQRRRSSTFTAVPSSSTAAAAAAVPIFPSSSTSISPPRAGARGATSPMAAAAAVRTLSPPRGSPPPSSAQKKRCGWNSTSRVETVPWDQPVSDADPRSRQQQLQQQPHHQVEPSSYYQRHYVAPADSTEQHAPFGTSSRLLFPHGEHLKQQQHQQQHTVAAAAHRPSSHKNTLSVAEEAWLIAEQERHRAQQQQQHQFSPRSFQFS